jgi:hypothetical protein
LYFGRCSRMLESTVSNVQSWGTMSWGLLGERVCQRCSAQAEDGQPNMANCVHIMQSNTNLAWLFAPHPPFCPTGCWSHQAAACCQGRWPPPARGPHGVQPEPACGRTAQPHDIQVCCLGGGAAHRRGRGHLGRCWVCGRGGAWCATRAHQLTHSPAS